MALGALSISPGMAPLSMGGVSGSESQPIVVSPGRAKLKTDKDDHNELVNIGRRLLEALTGRSEQGGDQPKPKSPSQKAKERDEKIGKSDTDKSLLGRGKDIIDSLTEAFGKIDFGEGTK